MGAAKEWKRKRDETKARKRTGGNRWESGGEGTKRQRRKVESSERKKEQDGYKRGRVVVVGGVQKERRGEARVKSRGTEIQIRWK